MKSLLFRKQHFDEPDLSNEFLELAQTYVSAWKAEGISIVASRQPDVLPHFTKANRNIQKNAIAYLRFNLEIMSELAFEGQDIKSNRVYLWRALKKMNFVPPHNVFDVISDDDIIEVYTMDDIQVFRSFNFFEITSYSIEEILCLSWKELMHRKWRPLLSMCRQLLKLRLGLMKGPETWLVAPHIVTEIPTDEKRRFMVAPQIVIPLKKNNQPVAVISTIRGRRLADTEELV